MFNRLLKFNISLTELAQVVQKEQTARDMKNREKQNCLWNFIENFSQQTSVHGLNIIGMPKLHILERAFWIIAVAMAAIAAISLAESNWKRFSANPTVVSIKKDYRNWENPFPAATGCFNEKVDVQSADGFIYEKWNVTPVDPKYLYYLHFVKDVANATYHNLDQFDKYKNDVLFNTVDMVELVAKVHPKLSGNLVTFHTKHKTNWKLILTELGACFTVNSKFSDLLSLKDTILNIEDVNEKPTTYVETLRCHYLNGLCYARYDSDPNRGLKYYIHSYLDVVHVSSDLYHEVDESEELEINYRMIETVSSPDIRYLTPTQRKCRFDNEPLTKYISVYSTSICYITCRYELALKLCGCKPFFYHFLGGKVCDMEGLSCLSKYADYITRPPTQIGCKCPQPCDLINYLPQVPKYTKWEHGYFDQRITFRWGLLPPTTKYRRDIIFGFQDLIVSIGGTVALFLGISFISIIEILFLTIENICKQYVERNTKKKTIKLFLPVNRPDTL